MAQGINTDFDFIPGERGQLFLSVPSQTLQTATAFALCAMIGVWILYSLPARRPAAVESQPAATAAALVSNPYGDLVDTRSSPDLSPFSVAQSIPFELNPNPLLLAPPIGATGGEKTEPAPAAPLFAESAPLPVPRPADLVPPKGPGPSPFPTRRLAQQNRGAVPPATSNENRTFFQKFFGLFENSKPALAYASAEDGAVGPVRSIITNPSPRYDRWTAVYDIAAHTVYMPDGRRLEAHSGLGSMLDDPRYVREPMRGPTPPNVYELQPREQLFHGVPALRLIPASGNLYGRTGLLAHTYMLGPHGDSNGCVSFRDYSAFLQAYQNGQIKRLVVVGGQS